MGQLKSRNITATTVYAIKKLDIWTTSKFIISELFNFGD